MHAENPGATFQAASQFNCLEFCNPKLVPEEGVTFYYADMTQGPACALACAAGTIVRNYFAPVDARRPDDRGQTKEYQINLLDTLGEQLDNARHKFWTVENGYTFSTVEKLTALNQALSGLDLDTLKDVVKVGVHADTTVTFAKRFAEPVTPCQVTQVYASALSCAYSGVETQHWASLAEIVLDAAYEATLWAAVLNRARGGTRDVFLTALGGGVFGNDIAWIGTAMGRAMARAHAMCADINVRVSCSFKLSC